MTEHNTESDIAADERFDNPLKRYFGVEEAVFILLVLLSLAGIAITDFSPHDGYGYWLMLVFVFAVLSIFVSWLQSKSSENDFGDILKQQGLHWAHTLIIVMAAFLLNKSGQFSETASILVTLLILSLATMLDGARIGWQFTLLGFFLSACAIIVAFVEAHIWACTGLATAIISVTLLWGYWQSKRAADNDDY